MAQGAPEARQPDRPPWQQRLLDDIFLLTAAGMIVPTVFYIVLGLLSLVSVPPFAP